MDEARTEEGGEVKNLSMKTWKWLESGQQRARYRRKRRREDVQAPLALLPGTKRILPTPDNLFHPPSTADFATPPQWIEGGGAGLMAAETLALWGKWPALWRGVKMNGGGGRHSGCSITHGEVQGFMVCEATTQAADVAEMTNAAVKTQKEVSLDARV
jgi:hypothetical protein